MPNEADPENERLSLGERCVAWCQQAMAKELRPSTATLKLWFTKSQRKGKPLGLVVTDQNRPNFCAAAQCFAALACQLPDETVPHDPRAAAKELMADAIKSGTFHGRQAIAQGFRPRQGDLAIYDRSIPGKPLTAWFGHVNRVTRLVDDHSYANIGANQGPNGAWAVATARFDEPRLLGFISYPAAPASSLEVEHADSVASLDPQIAEGDVVDQLA